MSADAIAEHALITAGIHLLERLKRLRFWSCRIIRPNEEIRISFAAILALPEGGRFVLVRNLHRPEAFAPFGGVYKYHDEAKQKLERMLFRPEDFGPGKDMKNDLRGYLPRRHLPKLVKWFDGRGERESPSECLRRELKEELSEIGGVKLKIPSMLTLRMIRRVSEGPAAVPGRSIMQYRILDVYELVVTGRNTEEFLRQLVRATESHQHLLLVNTSEIISGRAVNSSLISNHAAYLVGGKRLRPDAPPFFHGLAPRSE